ncbi:MULTISPECIES: hypothetical protein [unclassified Streptomyces]|uniref:hypothetical protein n=1 Tax=unclassified Streptomyces TaxID=2593676 RepID=UPI001F50E4A7|nr:hypothetical protein [Streptomyces sp. GZWMJZ-114]
MRQLASRLQLRLGSQKAAHEDWRTQAVALVDAGVEEATARKRVKVPMPTKPTVYKRFMAERGDDRSALRASHRGGAG